VYARRCSKGKTDVSEPRTYTVVLRPEPEGGFTVRVPALPEIVTFGEDESDALAMAKEAIELAVEHRKSLGEQVPGPGACASRVMR